MRWRGATVFGVIYVLPADITGRYWYNNYIVEIFDFPERYTSWNNIAGRSG
jgi:hypothetical protein